MNCPDNAESTKDCIDFCDCPVHKDFVRCDRSNCVAKSNPETLEEFKVALIHWQCHRLNTGCSHGQ